MYSTLMLTVSLGITVGGAAVSIASNNYFLPSYQSSYLHGVAPVPKGLKMSFDADKKALMETWNQLVASLSSAFFNYYQARKARMALLYTGLRQITKKIIEHIREIQFWRLVLALLPLIFYSTVFKYYKQLRILTGLDKLIPPNYTILSNIEQTLFSCQPHKLLASFTNPVFDCLAAVPYLFHFSLPFLFSFYLYVSPKRRPALYPFLWCVGWVYIFAVLFQGTIPTAPPWFTDSAVVDEHGIVIFEVPNEAGFRRVDHLFGVTVFHDIYSKNPVKFGSFPSLHTALPTVVFFNHPWGGKKVGLVHVIWVILAAMYSAHHYLIDAIGGILLVVTVRQSMLRIWSPFPELEEETTKLHLEQSLKANNPTTLTEYIV